MANCACTRGKGLSGVGQAGATGYSAEPLRGYGAGAGAGASQPSYRSGSAAGGFSDSAAGLSRPAGYGRGSTAGGFNGSAAGSSRPAGYGRGSTTSAGNGPGFGQKKGSISSRREGLIGSMDKRAGLDTDIPDAWTFGCIIVDCVCKTFRCLLDGASSWLDVARKLTEDRLGSILGFKVDLKHD